LMPPFRNMESLSAKTDMQRYGSGRGFRKPGEGCDDS
jgi:hypothetical protein